MRAFNRKRREKGAVKIRYRYDKENGSHPRLVFSITIYRKTQENNMVFGKTYRKEKYLDDWNGIPYNKKGIRYGKHLKKEQEEVERLRATFKIDVRFI